MSVLFSLYTIMKVIFEATRVLLKIVSQIIFVFQSQVTDCKFAMIAKKVLAPMPY